MKASTVLGTALVAAIAGGVALAAAPQTIDRPASATEQAVRLAPPTPAGPIVDGCSIFPADNAWNTDISTFARHPNSDRIIAKIQSIGTDNLHPDFGENPNYGIPYVVVGAAQPRVPITYDAFGDESDPGPFPIPLDARVEGAQGGVTGDRHVIALQRDTCELFELYVARRIGAGWTAQSGARFDLRSNALRPLGWTSADAAGLAIFPGLVRYEEVEAGEINHAIRVTMSQTRRGYILPATHFASNSNDPDLPPMGMRFRLRADVDLTGVTGQALVIATAMQRYGLIVADNGSNWFFQGAHHPGWDDDDLAQLKSIPGTSFEVVDSGPVDE